MKRLRIFGILLTVILLASCNKNEDKASGTGDVMIISKQAGTTTVYGLSMYAYTFSAFASVKAVSLSDTTKIYTLKDDQGIKTTFYYDTPESEFTISKPVASTFNFSAVFENGVKQEFQNTLTEDVLPIPTFEKCEYNVITHQLDINWTTISTANKYAINIYDGSKLVFKSLLLDNNLLPKFVIGADGGGWDTNSTPVSGKTYKVRLLAYLFEPGKGTLNIQSISIAEKTVVWGN